MAGQERRLPTPSQDRQEPGARVPEGIFDHPEVRILTALAMYAHVFAGPELSALSHLEESKRSDWREREAREYVAAYALEHEMDPAALEVLLEEGAKMMIPSVIERTQKPFLKKKGFFSSQAAEATLVRAGKAGERIMAHENPFDATSHDHFTFMDGAQIWYKPFSTEFAGTIKAHVTEQTEVTRQRRVVVSQEVIDHWLDQFEILAGLAIIEGAQGRPVGESVALQVGLIGQFLTSLGITEEQQSARLADITERVKRAYSPEETSQDAPPQE